MRLFIGLCFVCFAFAGTGNAVSQNNQNDKPNFVWLISEDSSKHYFQLFDQHGVKTPEIESLAREGLAFDHAFSNSPVCSVARTTLITSCWAPRLGAQYHRKIMPARLPDGISMFPQLLRAAGYYTANNSKKDYNVVEPNGVWDVSSDQATWRNRDSGQPFFYQHTLNQSHESGLHFSQRQFKNKRQRYDLKNVFVAPYHPQTDLFRYTHARYRDQIQLIDRQVGEILNQLRDDRLLDNTFVFFFGDHGGVLPRSKGYLFETGLHIPLVVRIPKNFRHLVPMGLVANSRVDGFVSFVDFGPTVLHLAGIPSPIVTDGRSFLGQQISKTDLNARETTFGYADRFDEKYDLVRSIRQGRFKYIRNFQPQNFDGLNNNYRYQMLAYQQWRELSKKGKLDNIQNQFYEKKPAEALFDLERDPHETKNLAGNQKHQGKLIQLRQLLMSKILEMPDLGFLPESVLVESALNDPLQFGRVNKLAIADLIRIANLQLSAFEDVKQELRQALKDENAWNRYWAVNTCCFFESAADEFTDCILELATTDECLLVRAKAAEFLGITKRGDPQPVLQYALKNSTSRIDQAMILNTVVLLQDGYGYQIDIERAWFDKRTADDNVEILLKYLLKSF